MFWSLDQILVPPERLHPRAESKILADQLWHRELYSLK